MWDRIKSLIIKEFLAVWQDKKSRTILILPPMVQLFLFAFAATLDVSHASIGIWNKDNGKYSYEFIQRFVGSPFFTDIQFYHSTSEIRDALDAKKVLMVLQIDEQFSRNILSRKPATIQLILDGRKSNSAQILQGYAFQILDQFQKDIDPESNRSRPKTVLIPRNWFNPNLIYQWFTVPGLIGILVMLIGLLVTALSVAREREIGTFEQLLVSPLLPTDILIGKMVPGVIIGMLEGTLIFLAAIFVFQIPFTGSVLHLYICMLLFVCSVVGIGLFISSLAKTQQQAILGVFSFAVPAVVLSGFATPVENMPEWLQTATLANPLRHFLVLVRGIFLKKLPILFIVQNAYPMVIIACFTLFGAVWFFRKKLE